MKLGMLNKYTNKLIKGKRTGLFFICAALVGTSLFFRLAEAAVYSIILYTGKVTPMGLFTGENYALLAITAIFTLLRYITSAPLSAASAYSFMNVCSEKPNPRSLSFGQALVRPEIWRRSIAALFVSKIIGTIMLVPSFFFGNAAIYFIERNSLFPAVHAAVLTLVSSVIWIRIKLSMSVIPYILAKYPKMHLLHIFLTAFRIMKNRRITLVRIILRYTLTLRIPKLFAASALFISISIKEDEYLEKINIHSGLRPAHDTPKLSYRSKRRFKKAAD